MSDHEIFDFNKLPDYYASFGKVRVFVGGCGAVNSAVVEKLAKMGVGFLDICDYDKLESANLSKSSSLYKYPEDIGINKAQAMAHRVNELLGRECAHGIDASIASFGPMAFTAYDLVVLGLDNYAAKIYFNQIWRQIPRNKRPFLIFGGTIGEAAQSNCLNGDGPCMRCLYSEGMLENPLAQSSCLGVQYRNDDPSLGIVVTTGLASGIAADLMCEQARAFLLGIASAANKRILYYAHPAFRVDEVEPMVREDCPDCRAFHPRQNMEVLKGGNTFDSTLGDLFRLISAEIAHDEYEVSTAVIEYAKISYGKVIADDFCKCCLKDLKGIYRHEFHARYDEMLCNECKNAVGTGKTEMKSAKTVRCVSAFSPKTAPRDLLDRKLLDLGYRIGEIYQVILRNGGTDFLDGTSECRYFYFDEDQKVIKTIKKLEG